MISEKGNLQEILFGKLLINLYEKKVTGILYLRVGGVLKEIYLNQGKIIWAVSTAEDEKLDNILIQFIHLDKVEVDKIKKEHHLSSTVSFFLQEKGIVTKENVIAAFLHQITRIFSHILTLQDGEYNFVYGLSPKKAIDMEMKIPDCLRTAIRENMKTDYLWKFLGSMKTELKRSEMTLSEENEEIISMISPEEKEILSQLEEWTPIDVLFERLSGKDQDALLRDIYMMAICGWVEKNEVPGEQPAGKQESIESTGEKARPRQLENLDLSGRLDRQPEIESIELDIPKKEEPISFSLAAEEEEPPPLKPMRQKKELSRNFPVKFPSSSKSRFSPIKLIIYLVVVIILGSTFAYLYLSGIIFPKKSEILEPVPSTRPRAVRKQEKPQTQQVEKGSETKPAGPQTKNTTEPQTTGPLSNEKLTADKDKSKPEDDLKKTGVKPQEPPVVKGSISALELFEKGKFNEAGNIWNKELQQSGIRFGILLELDCAAESVQAAYEQFTDKVDFYILNRFKNGRNCFLVLWGKFKSMDEAQAALRKTPPFFWKQSEPPSVIDLIPYMNSR